MPGRGAATQHYHTVDPIDNLVLRVVVRHIEDATLGDKADSSMVRQAVEAQAQGGVGKKKRTVWMRDFRWQEKELSPHDLAVLTRAISGSRAKLSRVQQDHMAMLQRRLEAGERPLASLGRVHLFSYVDKDGFLPRGELEEGGETTSRRREPTALAEAVAGLDLRGGLHAEGPIRERRARRRAADAGHLGREGGRRVMYLAAAVDVAPAEYADPAAAPARPQYGVHVLCRLRLRAGEDGNHLEARPPLARALPGGLLSTRRFTSAAGAVYEAAVYNAAAPQLDPLEASGGADAKRAARLRRVEAVAAGRAAVAARRRFADALAPPLPPGAARVVFANAELCAAERFDGAAALAVEWAVHLPSAAWRWGEGQAAHAVAGTTQTCRVRRLARVPAPHARTADVGPRAPRGGGGGDDEAPALTSPLGVPVAHFSLPIELELVQRREPEGAGALARTPMVVLAVWSSDGQGTQRVEGYGAVALPTLPGLHNLRVRTWRPDGSLRQRVQDLLVGGARALEDAAAAGADVGSKAFANKLGLRTEGSGEVHLRVSVMCMASPPAASDGAGAEARDTTGAVRGGAGAVGGEAGPAGGASLRTAEHAREGTAAIIARLRSRPALSASVGAIGEPEGDAPGARHLSATVGRMASQRTRRLPPLASRSARVHTGDEDAGSGAEGVGDNEAAREARRRAIRERRRQRRQERAESGADEQ